MLFAGAADPETWVALVSLIAMELVLGIDNIVFIAILTSRLPEERRASTARIGIGLALILRILLLLGIRWVMSLTAEIARVGGVSVTGKSLILLAGGLFLMAKAVTELHKKVAAHDERPLGVGEGEPNARAGVLILQILALDLVFSLDSVITAVGMVPAEQLWVMVLAVVVSVVVMLFGARVIGAFVSQHSTMKVLALAFLVLIGVTLVAEGLGQHFPKGYVYFAMAFSLTVELLNLRLRRKTDAASA